MLNYNITTKIRVKPMNCKSCFIRGRKFAKSQYLNDYRYEDYKDKGSRDP